MPRKFNLGHLIKAGFKTAAKTSPAGRYGDLSLEDIRISEAQREGDRGNRISGIPIITLLACQAHLTGVVKVFPVVQTRG